jgi:4-diphosphocytidyl-2-C-methyl-D-erythritol kinase
MTPKVRGFVTAQARAKINLYLHVLGRRKDGYHELDSLFVFADIADVVEIRPAKSLRLKLKGPFAKDLPVKDDNLILRAARLLSDAVEIKPQAAITLTKNLPIAAGLGGGSADAAAVFRALVRFWEIPQKAVDLTLLGLGLGADVPACLLSEPCFVGGIGELIEPSPKLPALPMILVNPGIALATASVFSARNQRFSKSARFSSAPGTLKELFSALQRRRNDLEKPAVALCPAVADVLKAIEATEGCRLARMSGSGATCFGLYDDMATAEQAASVLRRRGWWVEATVTASADNPWADV